MKEAKSQLSTLVHCIKIAVNVSLFTEKELNISGNLLPDNKIAALHRTNISPKPLYPMFQTTKMNSF